MRSLLCSVLVLALAPVAAHADTIRIGGETKYKPHSLVRLKAEGVDAKAALLWRVYPSKDVQRATSPRDLLELLASDPNATVGITLEIDAEFPQGASDTIKRGVSENAGSPGFRIRDWE
jgi:hypothetical protein